MASVFGVAFAASIGAVVVMYAAGVQSAIEDTWLGALLSIVAAVGVFGCVAAFVLGIVAKVRHERWALVWLPLCVLPAIVLFLMLGDAFWWE